MRSGQSSKRGRFGLIVVVVLLIIVFGIYGALIYVTPAPSQEISLPTLALKTPAARIAVITPTVVKPRGVTPSPTLTPTRRPRNTPTPTPEVPPGGIVYALSPDVNSVGWVQGNEQGNHFGESFLYTGLREGVLSHGVMQFDLSFIPNGTTIFLAELDLTGLVAEGLGDDSAFQVNILSDEIDEEWSRHNFKLIHEATIDESLSPSLKKVDLGQDTANQISLNAAQRSIIEGRLESNYLSLRIDSLTPDQESWFAWDSGYGEQSKGKGPVLRVGVLPPAATEDVGEAAPISSPTPTPTYVIITSTPTPENMQTAAAIALVATAQATGTGTPTPLPLNYVTPFAVTATSTPENSATALFQQAEATAAVIAFGTSTPTPQNMTMATPTPTATATPIYIVLEGELPPMTPIPLPTLTPQYVPSELLGKIAFKSDRSGREEIYVINPDGSELALLTNCWAYALAEQADAYSIDGRYKIFTKDVIRYRNIDSPFTGETLQVVRDDAPGLYWYDSLYKVEEQLTNFGAGIAYAGVWSPTREQIAFVSNDSQNDEIWVVNRDGSGLLQLTRDEHAWWDKHPSWSPDGQSIAFWSNRTGHGQIFVMTADGSNLYSLSRTGFNDYDPVWIKYQGIPVYNPDGDESLPEFVGSFGFCASGGDLNCAAFSSQPEAQAVFMNSGGPLQDIYGLDQDGDGLACESLSITESIPGTN